MEVELIREGLRDVASGVESLPALLVLTAAPALRGAGIDVPEVDVPEHRLYEIVAAECGDGAHSRYNALLRSIVRATRATRYAPITRCVLREVMQSLDVDGRVYLTGGASAILLGWREETAAIDLKLVPPTERMLRSIADLKERLGIGFETAPRRDGFIPELPGWEERSLAIEGAFYHYDFHSQCLTQLERGFDKDFIDAQRMVDAGLVDPSRLRELFDVIEPNLFRYPVIHPPAFRATVEAFLARQ